MVRYSARMTEPLTKKTLDAARSRGQTEASADIARRVAGVLGIDKEPPFVGIIVAPSNPRIIGGRFFPKERAILVYQNQETEVTGATIVHEVAHWANYVRRCGGVPRTHKMSARCSYVGQHDKKFYELLEKAHRELGVSTRAARLVEGRYAYPRHWRSPSWS